MKKTYLLLLLFSISMAGSVAQEAVSSAGNYHENAGISISWTLGETVTETFFSDDYILTQGFQQSYLTVTAIEEWDELDFILTAYPNPASDILNIYAENHQEKLSYALFDLQGKMITSGIMAGNNHQITVANLKEGIYFLNITEGNTMLKTFRIVKK